MAFERYAKSISWAHTQSEVRHEPIGVATVNLTNAFNALLQVFYLQHGHIPVTTKWRGADRYLAAHDRGEDLARGLESWLNLPDAWLPSTAVPRMLALERIVSGDYSVAPWRAHATDLWWHPHARKLVATHAVEEGPRDI